MEQIKILTRTSQTYAYRNFFRFTSQFLRKSFLFSFFFPPFSSFYERFSPFPSLMFPHWSLEESGTRISPQTDSFIFQQWPNDNLYIFISVCFFLLLVFKFTVKDKYQEIYLRRIISFEVLLGLLRFVFFSVFFSFSVFFFAATEAETK